MTPQSPVDLHLHSTASDGTLDPAALVAHVAACGVKLMALTDHDTVAGVEAADSAARQIGIAFVAGVEISADWRGRTIHVLGLAIDPRDPLLERGLEAQQQLRDARASPHRGETRLRRRPGERGARRDPRTGRACRRARISRARWSPTAPLRTFAPRSTAGSGAASPAM